MKSLGVEPSVSVYNIISKGPNMAQSQC
uniref:Uncharacterized protein n=1 Tax=Rhizophora mucronata TaxID=61149 RepID=A0A2P2PU24_RHIMU